MNELTPTGAFAQQRNRQGIRKEMNTIQVVRGAETRVFIVPGRTACESAAVILEGEDGPPEQRICLDVTSRGSSWHLELRGHHYGSPCIPIVVWERQSCIVLGLGSRLVLLAAADGQVMVRHDIPDELYISDLLVESDGERLLVATARSLLAFDGPQNPSWEGRDIAEDGVSIQTASAGEAVVVCEDPGDIPSIKRLRFAQARK